jgi:hypothetical protein
MFPMGHKELVREIYLTHKNPGKVVRGGKRGNKSLEGSLFVCTIRMLQDIYLVRSTTWQKVYRCVLDKPTYKEPDQGNGYIWKLRA